MPDAFIRLVINEPAPTVADHDGEGEASVSAASTWRATGWRLVEAQGVAAEGEP